MNKFIEAFYYGNIDAQTRSTKCNKAITKELEVLSKNENILTTALEGENKSKFLDYVNAWSVVNGESTLDNFIVGFRLGAMFTLDTFVNSDTPYTDAVDELIIKLSKAKRKTVHI